MPYMRDFMVYFYGINNTYFLYDRHLILTWQFRYDIISSCNLLFLVHENTKGFSSQNSSDEIQIESPMVANSSNLIISTFYEPCQKNLEIKQNINMHYEI